jgi:hypothetical protein
MKNRSCCDRGLIATSLALQKPSSGVKASFVMAASGTSKTVGPSGLEQILPTGLLRSELVLELEEPHALVSISHNHPSAKPLRITDNSNICAELG